MKQRLVLFGLLIAVSVGAMTACGSAPVAMVADNSAVDVAASEAVSAMVELPDEVKPQVVADLSAQGEITVIDVREDWEYAEGHISGATLIPLGSLPDRIDEIPTDKPVVLVCRSGNRSGQAFRYLSGEGFEDVHNMTGGMNAWSAAGLEIEK